MALTDRTARLAQLIDEFVNDLGAGTLDENKARQIRFLWGTTPRSQERDGLSYTLGEIEDMIRTFRFELSDGRKVQRRDVEAVNPFELPSGL